MSKPNVNQEESESLNNKDFKSLKKGNDVFYIIFLIFLYAIQGWLKTKN